MSGRAFHRIPYAVQVEFRTASSFLVAYSANLSRGGMFLETEHLAEIGSSIALQFTVPGAGPIHLQGRVTWRRAPTHEEGPGGIGIEFQGMDEELGALIDRLIAAYQGLNVLILAGRRHDRDALARLVRAVVNSAAIAAATDAREAEVRLTAAIDIAVIEIDAHLDDALRVVRKAKSNVPPVPVLAVTGNAKARALAHAAGADEIVSNPPSFTEFQTRLVRALGRPTSVRQERGD